MPITTAYGLVLSAQESRKQADIIVKNKINIYFFKLTLPKFISLIV
jgi:hypothetical protein